MTAAEIIKKAIAQSGTTQQEVAEKMGTYVQKLNGKIVRDTMPANLFLQILDKMGIDVTFTIRATGEVIRRNRPGEGRRVSGTSKNMHFDTAKADMVCNNFRIGGNQELYITPRNRYFIAQYGKRPEDDRVIACSSFEAEHFSETYGKTNAAPRIIPAEHCA